jgi:hypothetical protein
VGSRTQHRKGSAGPACGNVTRTLRTSRTVTSPLPEAEDVSNACQDDDGSESLRRQRRDSAKPAESEHDCSAKKSAVRNRTWNQDEQRSQRGSVPPHTPAHREEQRYRQHNRDEGPVDYVHILSLGSRDGKTITQAARVGECSGMTPDRRA